MKTRRTAGFTFIALLLFAGAIAASYLLSKNWTGLIVDAAVAAIMFCIILFGIYGRTGISALESAENSLSNMTRAIKQAASDPFSDMKTVLANDKLYINTEIKDAYENYKSECNRLYQEEQEYKYCDISDYINEELLNHIARSAFNDLVGSTMTGLGILGTFLGLTIGLQGFKNGNAEEMLETIKPLIEGIKVAFLTSIFGMVYSIAFNFFYHKQLRIASEVLNTFLETYYDHVDQRPDNEGFTRLIRLQSEQRDSMSQFAEDISLSFADQINQTFVPTMQSISDSMQTQAKSLPSAVSSAINESVVPSLTGIEDSIGQMADQLVNMQGQNMDKIAGDFMTHMDQAMGNQFSELKDSIVALCEWQEIMTENMKSLTESLITSGDNLNHISKDVTQAAGTVGNLVERLERSQDEILNHYSEVLENCTQISDMTKQQSLMMDEILQKEITSMESVASIAGIFENQNDLMKESFNSLIDLFTTSLQEQNNILNEEMQQRYELTSKAIEDRTEKANSTLEECIDSVRNGSEQIAKMHSVMLSTMVDTSSQMRNSSDAMTSASEDLSSNLGTALTRTFQQMDEQLADIEKHLSGTIAEIREVTESVPNAVQLGVKESSEYTGSYIKQVQSALETMSKTVEDREKALTAIIQQQQEIINTFRNGR